MPAAKLDDHALAFLIYTSGTTGNPKGVELTHLNLGATASAVIEVAPLRANFEVSVSFLPWAHVFGGCVEVAVLMGYGGALAICQTPDRLLDYLGEVKTDSVVCGATHLESHLRKRQQADSRATGTDPKAIAHGTRGARPIFARGHKR